MSLIRDIHHLLSELGVLSLTPLRLGPWLWWFSASSLT